MLTGTTTDRPADCGACGRTFPNLGEVFSHPCDVTPAWAIGRGLDDFRPPTNRADNIDAPERREVTGDRPATPAARPARTNRYGGKCLRCGGWVEAEGGLLVKNHAGGRGEAWAVEHKVSECPAVGTPAQGTPAVVEPAPVAPARPTMTGPQEDLLRRLIAERETAHPMDADQTVADLNTADNPVGAASVVIDLLMGLPRRSAPAAAAPADAYVPEKGDVHVIDGEFYRIHKGQRSRRFYACQWDGYGWEFAGGALRRCTTATLATAEDAARFGEMYHACVFCTRPLDTPESTAVGYGPVCAARRGLPWG
ncbi:MAG TPA: DUF6011 domain-containing protein [Iamia sp.]|nr:DUF6011 domain-containing protein [Iamia sp.]